jgi:hypothetical protein
MVDTKIHEDHAQTDVMTNGRRVQMNVDVVEGERLADIDRGLASLGGFGRVEKDRAAFGGVIGGGDRAAFSGVIGGGDRAAFGGVIGGGDRVGAVSGGLFGGSGNANLGGEVINGGFGKGGMFDRADGFGYGSVDAPARIVVESEATKGEVINLRQPTMGGNLIEKIIE